MENDVAEISPINLTAAAMPGQGTAITDVQATSDSIVVSWHGPNGVQVSNKTGYTVVCYKGSKVVHESERISDQNFYSFKYTIPNLEPGTKYVVEVQHYYRKFDSFGSYDIYKVRETVTTDTSQLPPPNGLSTQSTDCQQLAVSWNPVEHAKSYTVKYSESGKNNWKTLTGITQTSKPITGLKANTKYDIQVIAKGDGTHYTDSDPAKTSGRTIDATKLSPPKISGSATANSITIEWDKVDGAKKYRVAYAEEGGKFEYASTTKNYFTLEALSSGKTYTFKVRALGDDGVTHYDSDYSAPLSIAIPVVLKTPTVTNLNSAKHSISVQWDYNANASYYEVTWSPANSLGVSSAEVKDAVYTISNLKAGTKYSITVVAKGDGVRYLDSKESVKKSVRTLERDTLSTPTITTKSDANSIAVNWGSVAHASGYTVSWSPANKLGESWKVVNDANYTIAELEPGTKYEVTVRAKGDKDDYGDYKDSNLASANVFTVDMPKLNSPTNVKTSATATSISVSWDAVKGAKGYELYLWNATTTSLYKKVDVDKNACKFDVSKLTTYDVWICAKGDQLVSANSDFVKTSVTTPDRVALTWPDSSKLTATEVKPKKITVEWSPVANASDYVVEYRRYVASSKKWSNWSTFTTVSKDKTSASITTNAETKYQVRVKAIGEGDYKDSAYLRSSTITTPAKQLKAPGNLAKTDVAANSISVKWGKVANATGYDVFLYRDGKQVSKTESSTNSCTITKNVAANTKYEIKVKAKADGFTASPFSAALTVKTTPQAQLKAPGNLAKTDATANSISVKWDKVANATGYDVFLYRDGQQVSKTESSTNSCTIAKNVAANTKYEIKVKAKANGYAASPLSDALTVTTPKAQLKAPGNLAKTGATANSISIKWGKVANATGYDVFLYRDGQQVSKTESSTNSCTIAKNVAANAKYEIKVKAKANGYTASPLSDALIVSTPKKLDAPKIAELTSTAKTITVKWDAVANAKGYRVAYAPKGSEETDFKKIEIDDKTISCKITGLDAGKTYTVKVRALGDGGENYVASDFTVKNDVKTKAVVTLANPGNLVKTATSKTSISVKWDPVKNASGYIVRYAPKGSADSAFKKIETTDVQCTIKGLTAGTAYTVKVRAKGNGDQFANSGFTVKNFGSQLAAPQNVAITAYPKKLEIKWDSVKNASGYVVRYAPYGSADSAFKKIETTDAHCTITGLKPGVKYTVKIRAKGGDNFVASDFTVKNSTTKKANANASSAILDNAFADLFYEGVFEEV